MTLTNINLEELSNILDGELYFDNLHKIIYATDASVYRKIPLGISYPKNKEDLKKIIHFTVKNKTLKIHGPLSAKIVEQHRTNF